MAVTALAWNPLYSDLFAVGHGSCEHCGEDVYLRIGIYLVKFMCNTCTCHDCMSSCTCTCIHKYTLFIVIYSHVHVDFYTCVYINRFVNISANQMPVYNVHVCTCTCTCTSMSYMYNYNTTSFKRLIMIACIICIHVQCT